MVPLYRYDGTVERWMTTNAILGLEAAEKVTVIRKRNGQIARAFRRQADGKTNLLRTAYMGTKYSFNELLPTGHHAHDLKRLDGKRHGKDYAPEHLRPIFMTVIESVSVESNAAAA
jgi:hypothetical protein